MLLMRSWRNWQTRKTKDLVGNSMQVQFLSTAPKTVDNHSVVHGFFAHATVARTSYLYAGSREKYGIHRPGFFTKSVPYFDALPQGADTCRPHQKKTVILIQNCSLF